MGLRDGRGLSRERQADAGERRYGTRVTLGVFQRRQPSFMVLVNRKVFIITPVSFDPATVLEGVFLRLPQTRG